MRDRNGSLPELPDFGPGEQQMRRRPRTTLLRPTIIAVLLSEAAERCCYYGLISMLPLFLVEGPPRTASHIAAAATAAFTSIAYATPLIGSALAATRLRMFGTIMSLSLVYLVGMAVIPWSASIQVPGDEEAGHDGSIFLSRCVVFSGLCLIAFGTGGIKPNVAAFGALQVQEDAARRKVPNSGEEASILDSQCPPVSLTSDSEPSAHQASLASYFSAFYFLINIGSIFGQTVLPAVQKSHGYAAAFTSAVVVLCTAIIAFVGGEYCTPGGYTHEVHGGTVSVPPDMNDEASRDLTKQDMPHPSSLTLQLLLHVAFVSRFGVDWRRAEQQFGTPTCHLLREPVSTLGLISCIPLYWMGYASMGGLWIQQANQMRLPWGLSAAQWTAINPIVVLVGLPVAERLMRGVPLITRILLGMYMAVLSIMLSVYVQVAVDLSSTPHSVSAFWSLPHWILLAFSEVLTSVSGLELAYSGAGSYAPQLKSAMQACWLLCGAAGAAGAAIAIGLVGNLGLGPASTLFVLGIAAVLGVSLFWRRAGPLYAGGSLSDESGLHDGEIAPLASAVGIP